MEKVLSLFLSLFMVLGVLTSMPLSANAASVDDLTFELNPEGTMYQVKECDTEVSGDVVIPSVYKGLPVTKIASNAFYYCQSLRSVTIPASIRVIGDGAFNECYNLDAVYITDVAVWCELDFSYDSCNPLYYAKNLYVNNNLVTDLVVPDGVTQIRDFAFIGCTSIVSVTLPDTVISIGESSFENCSSLETVELSNNVTKIGYAAFKNCSSLKSSTIPNSVISIKAFAFYNCTSLASVNISENMDGISQWTFGNCSNLKNIVIPDGVLCINMYAFYNCTSLNNLILGNNIKSIMRGSFYNCSNLKNVTIPKSVESINSNYSACTYPSDVNITGDEYVFGYKYDSWEEKSVKIEDFTISGYNGSVAEKYANDNGFEFIEIECKQHALSDWITDKNATVDAAGAKHKQCTVCKVVLEKATIPQLKCAAPKLTRVESTGSGVKVTWSKTAGADSYIVYRKTYSNGKWSGWSAIKSGLSASATSYTDTTAKSGVYYIYTVRGVNEAGKGSYNSTGLKIKFLATPKLSSVANGSGKVTVKWSKVTGASNYTVYRKTYSNGKWSSWSKIGTTKNTYYNDAKVSSGKYYKYTVRATSGDYSSYFNTSGLKIKYLAVVSLKSATSQKAGVKVTWGKVTGAKGYEVYRKTYSNGKWTGWTKIKTVSGGSTVSYTDKSAKKGITYKYTVRAISDSNKGYYNTSGLQVKDKY